MASTGKKKGGKDVHHLSSAELVKSYVVSLLISVPCLAITFMLLRFQIDWALAHTIVVTILLLSVGNFVTLILLDHFQTKKGDFTTPALLATCTMVLLIVIVEGVDRFLPMLSFRWIYPLIAVVMMFKYLALFRERNLALKFYLAVNIVALAALWSLGSDQKISLPF